MRLPFLHDSRPDGKPALALQRPLVTLATPLMRTSRSPSPPGSPWAIDALIEDSGARHSIDEDLNSIYCRLAEQIPRSGWPWNVPVPLTPPPGGYSAPFFRAEFAACIGGSLRHDWPLKQIEQFWHVRGDTPKFAFYSASPIHDTVFWPMVSKKDGTFVHKRAPLEKYDAMLSAFLESLLRRSPNTLLLLHGDHGQQAGVEEVEFDMQVEHRLPWGRLLVPKGLVPNASRLRTNAQRLVSPFDLYATLQGAILRGNPRAQHAGAAHFKGSDASIDLLMTEVPALRTCREARIPAWLCPCQHEQLRAGQYSYGPGGIPKFDQVEVVFQKENDQALQGKNHPGRIIRLKRPMLGTVTPLTSPTRRALEPDLK